MTSCDCTVLYKCTCLSHNVSDSVFCQLCLSTRGKSETSVLGTVHPPQQNECCSYSISEYYTFFCVWKTAWTISGTGTITIYTFNESLCGKVMVGWVMGYGTRRRHRFRRKEGVTRYVNSLRYLSTDKLTQSDSVWLWSFTLCFPTDPGTGPGRK